MNAQHVREDGTCRVGMYVTMNGRARYMFPFYIKPAQWDNRLRRVRPGHLQHVEYNRAIAAAVSRVEVLALEPGATGPSIVARLDGPTTTGIRLTEAIALVLKERASKFKPQTLERLEGILRKVERSIPEATLEGLSPADVYRYREHVHAIGVQQNTLRWALKQLRILYRHACSHYGVPRRDVFEGAIPRELAVEHKNLTPEELEKLIAWTPPPDLALAYHAFLLAMYLGGMRAGDVLSLASDRITSEGLALRQGKSGAIVYAEVGDRARAIIDLYKGGPTVLPIKGNHAINKHLKLIARAVGINPKLSMHWARHAAADRLEAAGVDLRTIQLLFGHSTLKQTVDYMARRSGKQAGKALRAIG